MQGRTDILRHMSVDSSDLHNERGVFVTSSCPFLGKDGQAGLYSCMIHDTKPFYCRLYPDDGPCEHEENTDV